MAKRTEELSVPLRRRTIGLVEVPRSRSTELRSGSDPLGFEEDCGLRREKKRVAMQYLRELGTKLAALRRLKTRKTRLLSQRRGRYNTLDESVFLSAKEKTAHTSTAAKDELYEGFFSAFDKLSKSSEKKSQSNRKALNRRETAPPPSEVPIPAGNLKELIARLDGIYN